MGEFLKKQNLPKVIQKERGYFNGSLHNKIFEVIIKNTHINETSSPEWFYWFYWQIIPNI